MRSPYVDGMHFDIKKNPREIKDACKLMGFKLYSSFGSHRITDGQDDLLEVDGNQCYIRISALGWVDKVNHLLEMLGCTYKIIKEKRKHFIEYGEKYE